MAPEPGLGTSAGSGVLATEDVPIRLPASLDASPVLGAIHKEDDQRIGNLYKRAPGAKGTTRAGFGHRRASSRGDE